MEFDRHRVFRFGTRIKTRYEPHEIYLTFDPQKKGFRVREDPDIEKMKQLKEIMLAASDQLNQKAIREIARNELEMHDKEIRRLLAKGTDLFWTQERGIKNAIYYQPMSSTIELKVCAADVETINQETPNDKMEI